MAVLPTTNLESHPAGSTGLNGIINGNWERLEAIFLNAAGYANGDEIHWEPVGKNFKLVKGTGTLTDPATILWDGQTQGRRAKVTLADNRTIDTIANPVPGTYYLRVQQDATGSRTLTFGANFKTAGGTGPTLTTTANAVDLIEIQYFGEASTFYITNFIANVQ